MKRIVALTLSVLLINQNFAFAHQHDRTQGIGQEAISSAISRSQELKKNLQAVSLGLAELEKSIKEGERFNVEKGFAVATATLGAILTIFGGYQVRFGRNGNSAAGALFGVVGVFMTAASALTTAVNSGNVNAVEFTDDLKTKLADAYKSTQNLARTESDPGLKALAGQMELALAQVVEAITSHDSLQNSVKKNNLGVVTAQATAVFIMVGTVVLSMIGKGMPGEIQGRLFNISFVTSAIASIAGIYFYSADMKRSELLAEITKTRKSIDLAITNL